jgi:hypothetical protein
MQTNPNATAIQQPSPPPASDRPPSIPGPKILLVGSTGSGKTHAIKSLLDAGLEVFCIFTEPGMEVLSDTDPNRLHWHYIPPSAPSWEAMLDSATKINTMSFESLTKQGDINKRQYTEFLNLIRCLANFHDDRTGKDFGPVDSFSPETRAVVIDSLSGLNIMAMNLVAGSKPVKSMADWGVAMDNLERLITKLTVDVPCTLVMTAHLEREQDEVTGGVQLMASTLGKKLAPRLPRFFSDVIHCRRDGTNFFWSTASMNVDLKARNLPISDKLPASFVPLLKTWKERQK